jgi:hypothetical protein
MNVFTEVYAKSVDVLKAPALEANWKVIEADLKMLLETGGPNAGNAKVLDNLRNLLNEAGKSHAVATSAAAAEIIQACRAGAIGYQDRAALIKTMQHFYLIEKKGGQSVWVLDPPKAYPTWPYDQFAGKSLADLQTELQVDTEVFGDGNRKMMSDSLQLARKWAADAQVMLGSPSATTLETVKRWFHAGAASAEDVAASANTLSEGFKQIHAACNSSRVIFSDRPHLRASGSYDNVYASVNEGDVMPVIYIFQVFLDAGKRDPFGNVPKLWLCALTVIHELSHKVSKTEDIRYDDDGLKPGASFTTAQALKNADSWAYFAADLLGALSAGTITRVLA